MSLAYCLLLLFLCTSLRACNARNLCTPEKKLEKKVHISFKDDAKRGFENEYSSSKHVEIKNDDGDRNPRGKKEVGVERKGIPIPSALHNDDGSLVSVPWRVPHEKQAAEETPRFNVDYSPPKTHPPSHN